MAATNQYVEVRDGAYYLTGTRIGLDIVVHEFRDGRSPEEIFEAYPSIGSLAKLYGAITFILEHPEEIDSYLKAQDEKWEEFKASSPLSPEMLERFERAKRELPVSGIESTVPGRHRSESGNWKGPSPSRALH